MRPLNSASLRRASNAPIPLSIAHARTRTKTQHSRQDRGRGLGPLKVSDPGLVQPGRVPERLPSPRTGSTSLLECVSHNIERNHWSGGKKKKGERKWRRKERHKLSHSSPFGFFSSPKNTEEILFTPSFFFFFAEVRKWGRGRASPESQHTQRDVSVLSLSHRALKGGVKRHVFFLPFFVDRLDCVARIGVCVCVGGRHKGVFVVEEEERQCFAD